MMLDQLQKQHALALQESAQAEAALKAAKAAYEAKLNELLAADSTFAELHASMSKAQEASKTADNREKEIRLQAKDLIEKEFVTDLPQGYSQVRKKTCEYDETELTRAAIQHAPWLLRLDEKRVESFAFNMVVEVGNSFEMPAHIAAWLPLKVAVKPQARISDTTLAKLVISDPVTEPIAEPEPF
jgi:hypothetical protein